VVAAGCGGDDSTAIPPDPYATEQGFCDAFAKAICNGSVVSACYGSDESTLAEDTARCVENATVNACNPGDYAYHRGGAEACLAAIQAAYADARLTGDELEAAREQCLAAFSDNGGVGSSCVRDEDCDGSAGLRCVAKPAQDGTCQVPVLSDGDCSAEDAVCPDGEYCAKLEGQEVYVCAPFVASGSPCSETILCDPDESLCITDMMMMSSCTPKTDNGQTCTENTQCKGGFCVRPTGATEGTCVATLTLTPTDDQSCVALLP
jgi:hypothetical protein